MHASTGIDIESIGTLVFPEGVSFARMQALAKNQALEVFKMVAGCEPSQKLAKKESHKTCASGSWREGSCTEGIK